MIHMLGRNSRRGFTWGMTRTVQPFMSQRPGWVPGAGGVDSRLFKRWSQRVEKSLRAWRACKLWHRLHGTKDWRSYAAEESRKEKP